MLFRSYGKRVSIQDFRIAHRGGLGVRTIPTNTRNGSVIGLVLVNDQSTVLLIDRAGKIIRLSPTEIRTMGRQAQGVRLIKLEETQKLAAVVAFDESETTSGDRNNGGSATSGTNGTDDNQGSNNDTPEQKTASFEAAVRDESMDDTLLELQLTESDDSSDDIEDSLLGFADDQDTQEWQVEQKGLFDNDLFEQF